MLDLNEIAMFIRVVRDGSFSEAAKGMGIPASTLSRRITLLETSLNARLLQRTTRQLSLTTCGKYFFERCIGSIDGLAEAVDELRAVRTSPAGPIRVSAATDFFATFRTSWIAEFLVMYPDVQLEFLLDDALVDLIAKGVDIAFRTGYLPDSNLVAKKLAENQWSLAASPAYLSAHGVPASLQELNSHRCLMAIRDCGGTDRKRWAFDTSAGTENVEIQSSFRVNSLQALLDAVTSGLGIGLLPTRHVRNGVLSGQLAHVLPSYRRVDGGVYLVMPSRKQLPLAVSAFVEFVTSKARTQFAELATS